MTKHPEGEDLFAGEMIKKIEFNDKCRQMVKEKTGLDIAIGDTLIDMKDGRRWRVESYILRDSVKYMKKDLRIDIPWVELDLRGQTPESENWREGASIIGSMLKEGYLRIEKMGS